MKVKVTILLLVYMFSLLNASIGIPESKLEIIKNYRLKNWNTEELKAYLDAGTAIENSKENRKGFDLGIQPYYNRTIETNDKIFYFDDIFYTNYDLNTTERDDTERTTNQLRLSNTMSVSGNFYLNDRLFWGSSLYLDVNYINDREKIETENEDTSKELDENTNFIGRAFLGFGIGRIYNVTPVIRALRLNERLKKIGKGEMSDSEIDNIAYIISNENSYDSYYYRHDKYFWDDINEKSGDKLNGLSVREYEYLKEAMLENTGYRAQGYAAEFGVFFDRRASKSFRRVDDLSNRLTMDSFLIGPGFRFLQYNNLSTSLQLMLFYEADIQFNTMTDSKLDKEFMHSAQIDLLYNITDRLLFTNSLSYTYVAETEDFSDMQDEEPKASALEFSSSLDYFVQDRVDIYASFALDNYNIDNGMYYPFNTLNDKSGNIRWEGADYSGSDTVFRTGIALGIKVYFHNMNRGR